MAKGSYKEALAAVAAMQCADHQLQHCCVVARTAAIQAVAVDAAGLEADAGAASL
jgi:hypothetical protein